MVFTGIQGLNIFRIIQEATNNALKYAAAQNVQVVISKTNNEIHFSIKDNGKGFAEQQVEPGNGLINMRKRALELGGSLSIESAAGNGTLVAFNVALNDQ
ncbi:Sensor protein VraS [compost metagenome]